MLHNHPADGATTAFGITLEEVHVVADNRKLAFAVEASGTIPDDVQFRVHLDMEGSLLNEGPGPKYSVVLEASRHGAEGAPRVEGSISGQHAVLVVPFGDLPRPSRDLEGGFWYFVELVGDGEAVTWPDGPHADLRTPEKSAGVVPIYPWDQVLIGTTSLPAIESAASLVGGHVITVIDHRDLDPALGLTAVIATDPEVPLLEHVEHLDAWPELSFASPNWVLTGGLPEGQVGCPPQAVRDGWERFGDERQYAPALHRIASLDPSLPTAHQQNTGASVRFGSVLDREIIFVLDGGVEPHPSLGSRVLTGFDARSGGAADSDEPGGHGTGVAGIAAASPVGSAGMLGAAPSAEIFPIRVMCTDCPSNAPQRLLRWVADLLGYSLPFGSGTMTLDRLFNGLDLAARTSRMSGRWP
ncbi:MAG: S8 family serine peptidase, partial [Myxococcota bacterium]